MSASILKEKVCQAVELEIHSEVEMCEITDDVYLEIASRYILYLIGNKHYEYKWKKKKLFTKKILFWDFISNFYTILGIWYKIIQI